MKVRIRVAFTVEIATEEVVRAILDAIAHKYEKDANLHDVHVVAVSRELPNGKLEVGHSPTVRGG